MNAIPTIDLRTWHATVLAAVAFAAALLLRVAAARFRRASVVRRSRGLPSPPWHRLLHVLLGLPHV